MARRVVTPNGEIWTLRRRWLPHRKVSWRRVSQRRERTGGDKEAGSEWWHVIDVPIPDINCDLPAAMLIAVGLIVFCLLAWFIFIPLLLLVVDIVVVIVVAVCGVVARMVFHRPWEIEAIGSADRLSWSVVGWRRSATVIDRAERDLAAGLVPGPTPGEHAD